MQLPIFVYGTLKPGEPNYLRYLTGQTAREQPAWLVEAALFTEGPYPFLVTTPDLVTPTDVVQGVLITLRPPVYDLVMADLDRLEGFVEDSPQTLYQRVALEVNTPSGPQRAWIYLAGTRTLALIRRGALRRIAGGNWPEPTA